MFTGPNIVRDGLVLALDAANGKSFKGEPTVNVINGGANRANVVTVPISVGNHASISKSTSLTSYSSDRPNVLRYTSTNNTGYSMLNQQFSIQNQSGTTYTYSFEYKQLAGASNALQYSVVYKDGYKSPDSGTAASSISNTQIDLEDGWKRWILTYTSTYTGYNYIRFNIFTGGDLGTGDGDFDFYFDNFMLQEGSKRTRFVDGTRGTTVAAGGGWKDMSGRGNHGEILNGTTTSDDGSVLGALDFDGTNDYIEIPYNSSLAPSTAITMEALCYVLNNGGNWISVMQYPYSSASHTSPYFEWGMYLNMNDRKMHTRIDGETADSSTLVWNFNEWTHFVITFEAQTVKFYANGQNVGNDTVTKNSITYNTNNNILISGNASTTELHEGKIAYCRLYNRALSASEVLQNYNSLKTRFGL